MGHCPLQGLSSEGGGQDTEAPALEDPPELLGVSNTTFLLLFLCPSPASAQSRGSPANMPRTAPSGTIKTGRGHGAGLAVHKHRHARWLRHLGRGLSWAHSLSPTVTTSASLLTHPARGAWAEVPGGTVGGMEPARSPGPGRSPHAPRVQTLSTPSSRYQPELGSGDTEVAQST